MLIMVKIIHGGWQFHHGTYAKTAHAEPWTLLIKNTRRQPYPIILLTVNTIRQPYPITLPIMKPINIPSGPYMNLDKLHAVPVKNEINTVVVKIYLHPPHFMCPNYADSPICYLRQISRRQEVNVLTSPFTASSTHRA